MDKVTFASSSFILVTKNDGLSVTTPSAVMSVPSQRNCSIARSASTAEIPSQGIPLRPGDQRRLSGTQIKFVIADQKDSKMPSSAASAEPTLQLFPSNPNKAFCATPLTNSVTILPGSAILPKNSLMAQAPGGRVLTPVISQGTVKGSTSTVTVIPVNIGKSPQKLAAGNNIMVPLVSRGNESIAWNACSKSSATLSSSSASFAGAKSMPGPFSPNKLVIQFSSNQLPLLQQQPRPVVPNQQRLSGGQQLVSGAAYAAVPNPGQQFVQLLAAPQLQVKGGTDKLQTLVLPASTAIGNSRNKSTTIGQQQTTRDVKEVPLNKLINQEELLNSYKALVRNLDKRIAGMTKSVNKLQERLSQSRQEYSKLKNEMDKLAKIYRQQLWQRDNRIKELKMELLGCNELLALKNARKFIPVKESGAISPLAAALLKSGMSVTQICIEFGEALHQLQLEKEENARLTSYVEEFIKDVDEKVPLMILQKLEAEAMIDSLTKQLNASLLENIVEVEMNVDPKHHRHFVAKKGELLHQISDEFGSIIISFPRIGVMSDKVILKGAKNCIEGAQQRILEVVSELENRVTVESVIPLKYHGLVMGSKGHRDQDITQEFGVSIKFPDSNANAKNQFSEEGAVNGEDVIDKENLSGERGANRQDVILVYDEEDKCEAAKNALLCLLPVTRECKPGKGRDVCKMMDEYDVNILIPPAEERSDVIRVTGPRANVDKARDAFLERVLQLEDEKQQKEEDSRKRVTSENCPVHQGTEASNVEYEILPSTSRLIVSDVNENSINQSEPRDAASVFHPQDVCVEDDAEEVEVEEEGFWENINTVKAVGWTGKCESNLTFNFELSSEELKMLLPQPYSSKMKLQNAWKNLFMQKCQHEKSCDLRCGNHQISGTPFPCLRAYIHCQKHHITSKFAALLVAEQSNIQVWIYTDIMDKIKRKKR